MRGRVAVTVTATDTDPAIQEAGKERKVRKRERSGETFHSFHFHLISFHSLHDRHARLVSPAIASTHLSIHTSIHPFSTPILLVPAVPSPLIPLNRPPPINLQRRPRNKRAIITSIKQTRGRDVARLRQPAHGHVGQELAPVLRRVGDARERLEQARPGQQRVDAVHPDVVRGVFGC